MAWERRRFLILVKTYPNPSASLQEVVCTAAVDHNGNFVRLFPIPFRTMDEAARFKKWQWIQAAVTKADNDSRLESFKVDATSITSLDVMPPKEKGWRARWAHVESLVSPSLEYVKTTDASIALIKPATFDLVFTDEPEPEWTKEQREKLLGAQGAVDLFGNASAPLKLLEKLPVKIQYRYTCSDPICNGHQQLFEDWEVGQSWRSWSRRYPDRAELEQMLRQRYVVIPREKDNLFLFVGTMARHPDTWLVIGHAQPLHLAK